MQFVLLSLSWYIIKKSSQIQTQREDFEPLSSSSSGVNFADWQNGLIFFFGCLGTGGSGEGSKPWQRAAIAQKPTHKPLPVAFPLKVHVSSWHFLLTRLGNIEFHLLRPKFVFKLRETMQKIKTTLLPFNWGTKSLIVWVPKTTRWPQFLTCCRDALKWGTSLHFVVENTDEVMQSWGWFWKIPLPPE